MNEEQVEVVKAERLKRGVKRLHRIVMSVETVVELAGDEHVGSIEAGLAYRFTDTLLVAVHLCRVDVPVANLERLERCILRLVRFHLIDAEAELRDLDAVVERDVGD